MGSCAGMPVPAVHAPGSLHPAACQSAVPESGYGLAQRMHTALLVSHLVSHPAPVKHASTWPYTLMLQWELQSSCCQVDIRYAHAAGSVLHSRKMATAAHQLLCAHRSESLGTTLVCLATTTLYDEDTQKKDPCAPPSAVRASTGSLKEQDDGNGEAQLGGSDQDEDAASFRTAEGNSDEAPAPGIQVASCACTCLLPAL